MQTAFQFFAEGAIGLAIGLLLVSPTEWLLHRYLLHAPKVKRRWYNRFPSEVHSEGHHMAYLAPEHYYRDSTNAHERLAFPLYSAVGIPLIGGALGLAVSRLWSLLPATDPAFNGGDVAHALGWALAAGIGYVGYEVPHHYMHVLGPRRLQINRELGDRLQRERDGKLRLSKPLLDDICGAVEDRIDDGTNRPFDPGLLDRLERQLESNRERGVELSDRPLPEVLREVTEAMRRIEDEERASLTPARRLLHRLERRTQRIFRGSRTLVGRYFTAIDNNHFVHHRSFTTNYNVFIPWADWAFGTRRDYSREGLERDRNAWLCPNSPDG